MANPNPTPGPTNNGAGQNRRPTSTPINVCTTCGCNSSGGHTCRGRRIRSR